jgi:hypothetical protein
VFFIGNTMEIPWKYHGNTMEIPWKYHGKWVMNRKYHRKLNTNGRIHGKTRMITICPIKKIIGFRIFKGTFEMFVGECDDVFWSVCLRPGSSLVCVSGSQ